MRIRDFIRTIEGLYFAVNSYVHPPNKIYAFLRYVPYDLANFKGLIREINGKKYIKIPDTETAYKFLEDNFKKYLFFDENIDVLMHAINKEDVEDVYYPNYKLLEIIDNPKNSLEEKCRKLALILEDYGVSIYSMGVTGSLLIGLSSNNSDIDFVVYGENFNKARYALKEAIEDKKINPLSVDFWKKAYEKRIKNNELSFKEFIFYEKRKYNRGVIDNTMFDLLYVREYKDIKEKYGTKYKNLGFIKIEGEVLDDSFIFDNPAVYKIECYNDDSIKEVVSFTHTYSGQAFKGEKIVVRGKLELVNNDYKRVVVGTTREAINEYIKLKDLSK